MELRRPPELREPDEALNQLAFKVIGAAIEVHKVLGPGFNESVYEEALAIELEERGIPFIRQVRVELGYKGRKVGEGRMDLLAAGQLVVEIKAVEKLLPVHSVQVLSYLKATGKQLGLLINFNVPVLKDGVERITLVQNSKINFNATAQRRNENQILSRFITACECLRRWKGNP